MDSIQFTEELEKLIFILVRDFAKEHGEQIKVTSDSHYSRGTITIQVTEKKQVVEKRPHGKSCSCWDCKMI